MEGNLGYLVAGYALTWIVLAWYARRIVRRTGGTARALDALESRVPHSREGGGARQG